MAVSFVQKRFVSTAVKKWAYNLSGFNKYGLHRDDLLDEYDPDVIEALRRCPQKTVDERNYRALRATQLSIQHSILPKDQWTKFEEDKLYLTPIVDQVIKEREERENWDKNL